MLSITDEDLAISPFIMRSITGLINANCAPMNSVKSPMQSRVRKNIFQCGFAYENSLPHSLIVLFFLDISLYSLTGYAYKTLANLKNDVITHKPFVNEKIESVEVLSRFNICY